MPTQRPRPEGDHRTLEEALRETAQRKWQGRRCYATNMSQATAAARHLANFRLARSLGSFEWEAPGADLTPTVCVHEVSAADLRACIAWWYKLGLSPATINKRLNCLSAMGVSVEGCRVREPKVLKWWLKPEDEEAVCKFLRMRGPYDLSGGSSFACLIEWTTRTGLRIEESLRLTWQDVNGFPGPLPTVTVPGLKTAQAQATLPLGPEAVTALARARTLYDDVSPGQIVFGHTYESARGLWEVCRARMEVSDNPTATLKALRRSAARHLHVTKGMPLDMVRQYLRHEDIETTMGYLRLTGGYGTEEMRKWL